MVQVRPGPGRLHALHGFVGFGQCGIGLPRDLWHLQAHLLVMIDALQGRLQVRADRFNLGGLYCDA